MTPEEARTLFDELGSERELVTAIRNAAAEYRLALGKRRNVLEIHSLMDTPGSRKTLERELEDPSFASARDAWITALAAYEAK